MHGRAGVLYDIPESYVADFFGYDRSTVLRWVKWFDMTGGLGPRSREHGVRWRAVAIGGVWYGVLVNPVGMPVDVIGAVRYVVLMNLGVMLDEIKTFLKDEYPWLKNTSLCTALHVLHT